MDHPESVITGAAALAVIAKQGQDFIGAATGHPGESMGTIFGGWMRRRKENAERVASGAHLTLLNIGLKADEVPLRVLMPALEHASVEEDMSMQDRWSNLLANAADPRHEIEITQTHNTILAELTPVQAKMLDAIYRNAAGRCHGTISIEDIAYSIYDLQHIYHEAIVVPVHGPSAPETITIQSRASIDVLKRTGLLDTRTIENAIYKGNSFSARQMLVYTMSALGLAFYRACQPPPRRP
jgi:hypothetical protein